MGQIAFYYFINLRYLYVTLNNTGFVGLEVRVTANKCLELILCTNGGWSLGSQTGINPQSSSPYAVTLLTALCCCALSRGVTLDGVWIGNRI
jgi:hypothetical protein